MTTVRPTCSIYVEFEVRRNSDNLNLAVVDFEVGGRTSETFCPDLGAVLMERRFVKIVRPCVRPFSFCRLRLLATGWRQLWAST